MLSRETMNLDKYVQKEARRALRAAKRSLSKTVNQDRLKGRASLLEEALDSGDVHDTRRALSGLQSELAKQWHPRNSLIASSTGLIGAVLVALWLRGCVVGAFSIPSQSMAPMLLAGDYLFVNKLAYSVKLPYTDIELLSTGTPERGEIVVFPSPCEDKMLIKRIAAVGGDTIEMRCEKLYINDKLVEELPVAMSTDCHDPDAVSCNVFEQTFGDVTFHGQNITKMVNGEVATISRANSPSTHPFEFTDCGRSDADIINGQTKVYGESSGDGCTPYAHYIVPEGYALMMGDNRRNSNDGMSFGPVPMKSIVGKAVFIFASKPTDEPFWNFWKYHGARMGQIIHDKP